VSDTHARIRADRDLAERAHHDVGGRNKAGTVGRLLPTIEARLVIAETADGDAAEDAKPGEPGELWLRGGSIMKARVRARSFFLCPTDLPVAPGLPE